MKVIFLGDSLATQDTGIHYYGMQLIHNIMEDFPQHEYAAVFPRSVPEVHCKQIIVPLLFQSSWSLRFRQLWHLPKKVMEHQPDMVIELAHFGPFNLPSHVQRVTVIHDLTPILFPDFHRKPSTWAHKILLPRITRQADHVVSNSEYTKQDIIKHLNVSDDKIHVVYPKVVPPDRTTDQAVDLPNPYFLTVGTIEPRKDHVTILKAFDAFCQTDDNFHLAICGKKGWLHGDFDRQMQSIKNRHRVHLTGYVSRDELWRIYRNASALILASQYEGFGLPVLEAMSFGLPLVLANNSSLAELGQDCALLFTTGDAERLKEHLILLTGKDLQRTYGERSSHRFQQISALKPDLTFLANPS